MRERFPLKLRGESLTLGERTWVMGILNVTPDSFSDGGRFEHHDRAILQGSALFKAGADIVDIGGESTRPGGARVTAEEERRRVVPVIEALRKEGWISVDTSKAEVAEAALDAGADLVNDVSGFLFDPELPRLVAERGVPVVLMHLRGEFETMHEKPHYKDVMGEVASELEGALGRGRSAGIPEEKMIVDPGVGFGKNASHSLEVLRRLPELKRLGRPLLVGPSRKSFIGAVLGNGVEERLLGTAAAVAASVLGGAHIVRVHDVKEMGEVVRVCDAILEDRG